MSHFYGTLQGNRGEATRCGSKASGIVAHAASWQGAVRAYVYYNKEYDQDWAKVSLVPWSYAGVNRLLYHGPVDGSPVPVEDDT